MADQPIYDALSSVGSALVGGAFSHLLTARNRAREARALERKALQNEMAGLKTEVATLRTRLDDDERKAS